MELRRREFLVGGGLAVRAGACASHRDAELAKGPTVPQVARELDDVLRRALRAATLAGATYADARIVRRSYEWVGTREDHVMGVSYNEAYGIGVRALVSGAWGFSSSSSVEGSAAEEAARRAAAMAKANAAAGSRPVVLADIENGEIVAPVNNFRWNHSPITMLKNCDALTKETWRISAGARVPAIRTHEFNMASLSDAV